VLAHERFEEHENFVYVLIGVYYVNTSDLNVGAFLEKTEKSLENWFAFLELSKSKCWNIFFYKTKG